MVGTDVSIVVEKDPLADQFPAESRSWTYRIVGSITPDSIRSV